MKTYRFRQSHAVTVPDRYSLTAEVGSGSFGIVLSGTDTVTRMPIAMKMVQGALQHVVVARQTLRELRLLRHFRGHQNIVSLLDIFRTDETEASTNHSNDDTSSTSVPLSRRLDLYLVFELMEGDLSRVLCVGKPLSLEHTRYFTYQLLRGLKYLHSANVIHRDLKPQNLLINGSCALKIADFGMARVVARSSEEHQTFMTEYVATRWYRAPEVMLNFATYETVMDMWSVGCIMCEMFGAAPIFSAKNIVDQLSVMLQIIGSPAPEFSIKIASPLMKEFFDKIPRVSGTPLVKLFPDVDPMALDLVSKLLVLDPALRSSAVAALEHPFVGRYHNRPTTVEPTCAPATLEFDDRNMSLKELVVLIFAEIAASSVSQSVVTAPLPPAPAHMGHRRAQSLSTEPLGFNGRISPVVNIRAAPTPPAPSSTVSASVADKIRKRVEQRASASKSATVGSDYDSPEPQSTAKRPRFDDSGDNLTLSSDPNLLATYDHVAPNVTVSAPDSSFAPPAAPPSSSDNIGLTTDSSNLFSLAVDLQSSSGSPKTALGDCPPSPFVNQSLLGDILGDSVDFAALLDHLEFGDPSLFPRFPSADEQ